MSILSAVQGSGVELIPAGKCAPWLKMTTTDRLNMDSASVVVTVVGGGSFESTVNGVTQTGTSRSVPLDSTGRGRIMFDSGKRYNFYLNHGGNYTNDGDQQLDAESTTGPWVNWELMSYPSVSTVTTVSVTYRGAGVNGVRVVATNGSITINGTTAANGNAVLRGLDTGTWTVSLPDYNVSQTLVVDMLMESLVFSLGGIDATVTMLPIDVTISGPVTQTKAPVGGVASFGPLPAGTYIVTTAQDSKAVSVSTGVATVTVHGGGHRWTARISIATTDPEDRVEYLNDAAGLTPASGHNMGSWATQDILSYVAPCVVSNGVKTYLNKRDLTKTIAGAASNIAMAGNDAMVEFKKLYLALYTSGNYIYIEFADYKIDSNFHAYAHTYAGIEQSAFYWGCYQMHVSGNKVYSVSGQQPYADISITNSIAYAKARGAGYDIMKWYHTIFVECLFVILYKSTDGQTALGRGLTSGGKSAQTLTKFDNDFGIAGSTSSTEQMAFLWVVNFWGNCYQWVGGAKTNSSYKLMTILGGDSSVNDSDFTNRNIGPSSSINGYISKVAGSADGGFLPTECSGSATTLWCDYGYVRGSYFPSFGGYYGDGDYAGPFGWYFYSSAAATGAYISSRLSLSVGLA
jgi:hypothetical protein